MQLSKEKTAERLTEETGFSIQVHNGNYSLLDSKICWFPLFGVNDVRRRADFIKYEQL